MWLWYVDRVGGMNKGCACGGCVPVPPAGGGGGDVLPAPRHGGNHVDPCVGARNFLVLGSKVL